MPFVKVASLSDLPPGNTMQVDIGEETIAICNVDGEIHVLEGICPHAGGPLGQGALHGKMLVCPWHAWEYDCTTGKHDRNENYCVAKLTSKVEDGDILVELP